MAAVAITRADLMGGSDEDDTLFLPVELVNSRKISTTAAIWIFFSGWFFKWFIMSFICFLVGRPCPFQIMLTCFCFFFNMSQIPLGACLRCTCLQMMFSSMLWSGINFR